MTAPAQRSTGKIPTGISGLDHVLSGGIPRLSINIISGAPGSGKTILVQQAMFHNAAPSAKALYLTTLSEPAIKMLHYLQKFSFYDPNKVNTDIIYRDIGEVVRQQSLPEAIDVIINHVQEHKPNIVVIDSFKAIHDMAKDVVEVRKFGYDLAVRLITWNVTTFFIGEYTAHEIETEPIFAIADGIIRLHYQPQGLHYQRFVDVLKMRGEGFFEGFHPLTISSEGLIVYPRIRTPLEIPHRLMSDERVSTGLRTLDDMLEGGLLNSTTTMVAGGAGTGKTLLGLHFITAGIANEEPGVIVTFQENPDQLKSIALSLGWDLRALEERQLLVHLYHSPVELQPDIHAARIREVVERIQARRIFIDSIKDIEISTPDKVRYKDYIYSLVNEFKLMGVTTMLSNEIPELFGPFQLSEYGVSFIADNVILLRYLEQMGRMSRALSILKVRGSQHSKDIREFEITRQGIQIGQPVRVLTGALSGSPVLAPASPQAYLPPRTRYILDTLRQIGAANWDVLLSVTHLPQNELIEELEDMQQQGLIIQTQRNGEIHFKATV